MKGIVIGLLGVGLAAAGHIRADEPKPAWTVDRSSSGSGVAYSPDGRLLAVGVEVGVWVLDAATGREVRRLDMPGKKADQRTVYRVAFSPDGKLLVAGDWAGNVGLWDTATGKELAVFRDQGRFVGGLAFSPDGNRLAVSYRFGDPAVWDVGGAKIVHQLKGHDVSGDSGTWGAVAYSADGRCAATAAHDKAVRLWDAATGKLVGTVPLKDKRLRVEGGSAVFDPDDLPDMQAPAHALWFHPNRPLLAVGCSNGAVVLWDVAAGKEVALLHRPQLAPNNIVVSLCGDKQRVVALDGEGQVRGWDIGTGRQVFELRVGLRDSVGDVPGVALSPDRKWVTVAAPARGEVSAWPVDSLLLK